jgi:elongation factor G
MREIAGKTHSAEVSLEIAPLSRGAGFQYSPANSSILNMTDELQRAIRDGAKDGAEIGALAGYPLIDVGVTLKGAKIVPDEASAMAFKIAAANAFREALKAAKSLLLEPMFNVEVVTPEEFMGNVIGDLNARRGKVTSMNPRAGSQVISAELPLMTMFGYATDLRSISQGRATFSMEFREYTPVPPKVEQEILAKMGR